MNTRPTDATDSAAEKPADLRFWPQWVSTSLLAAFVMAGCASLTSQLTLPPVEEVIPYHDQTYPMVVSRGGTAVYLEHDSSSRQLRNLPQGAIVTALAEAGSSGKVAYYNVRTLSGIEGWVKRWKVKTTTSNKAEIALLRQQQVFEQSLQDTILATVATEIVTQNLHPLSRIESSWIAGGVASDSSVSNVNVSVTTIMRGAILGTDKYQIDSEVSLFLHVDRDYLPSSAFEVNRVVVVNDEKVKGMPSQQKLLLLKIIGPMFGFPTLP